MTYSTQQPIERGAASMLIELRDGTITVRHGTDNTLLATIEQTPPGSWRRICQLLHDMGARMTPTPRRQNNEH